MAGAVARAGDPNPELARVMSEAHWHLLRAETSCNFYWGEAWVHKSHADLDSVAWHLGEAKGMLGDRLSVLLTPAEAPAVETVETVEATDTSESVMPVDKDPAEASSAVEKPV